MLNSEPRLPPLPSGNQPLCVSTISPLPTPVVTVENMWRQEPSPTVMRPLSTYLLGWGQRVKAFTTTPMEGEIKKFSDKGNEENLLPADLPL